MYRIVVSNELFTVLILLGLIFVALSKLLYTKRFSNFIFLPGNSKYLLIHTREQKFFDKFDALLFLNLIISLTLFLAICARIYNTAFEFSIPIALKLMVAVSSFFLIKVLIERLLGSLFEIDEIMNGYLFQKTSYKNYFGLLLVPINALFIYTFTPDKFIIITVVAVFIVLSTIGLLVSFKTHQNTVKRNMFYFILYLCALEIAPYIVLFKLLQLNGVI